MFIFTIFFILYLSAFIISVENSKLPIQKISLRDRCQNLKYGTYHASKNRSFPSGKYARGEATGRTDHGHVKSSKNKWQKKEAYVRNENALFSWLNVSYITNSSVACFAGEHPVLLTAVNFLNVVLRLQLRSFSQCTLGLVWS